MTDTFEQMAVRAYETAMGQELRQQDKASVLKVMAAFRDELAKISAPSDDREVYVEFRQCDSCGHVGINDSDGKKAACHNCDWSGDSPVEDKCPGCGDENCMAAACPKCGCRYSLLAEETIASAPADTVAKDSEIESLRALLAKVTRERDAVKCLMDCYNLGGWTDSIGVAEQLLATQANAARVVEALERLSSTGEECEFNDMVGMCFPLDEWNDFEATLSIPINLDAFHEHDAQLLRGTAEKWKGVEGVSPYEFLINEATAHRAKKEAV